GLGPAAEEAVEPGVHLRRVMEVAVDVLVPIARARHARRRVGGAGPAVHLGVVDLGMELEADAGAVAERLVGVGAGGCGKVPGAARQLEAPAIPLVAVRGYTTP